MLNRVLSRLMAPVLALLLVACATPQPVPVEIRQGRIEQISDTTIASNQHRGVGAVLGGLAGVGIGSLLGGGTGRDVAMVAGAVGGALAGNEIQKREAQPLAGQQIFVRMKSGVIVEVTQPVNPSLRVGQEVFIQGSGESAVVVPR